MLSLREMVLQMKIKVPEKQSFLEFFSFQVPISNKKTRLIPGFFCEKSR